MKRGKTSDLCFLKSGMISLVFVLFRDKLFAEHHSDSFRTSSLSANPSLPVISTTTVVSSANLMMALLGLAGLQAVD